ncbi:MAG: glycine/betaine/sarcosine/D-proline family reductase selenoprotein B [Burkholderiales bacterium]|nr:glycine/betaine/sarcosine/D-proline family reductase selenoprotein B [Burkholderiales bacterium]
MTRLRVVHYLNQFFAGVGAEAMAHEAPGVKRGAVGPGVLLNRLLGERGEVAATVYCGDDHLSENGDAAIERILDYVREERPDLVVAGPAFNAGRYGMACGRVCTSVEGQLGVASVAGMYPGNPGVELYRGRLYVVETGNSVAGMAAALERMAALGVKLARGERIGPPGEEGYVPRGLRYMEYASRTGAERAVDVLVRRLNDRPFETEWPIPVYDRVPAPPPIRDLAGATIALVSTGGIVPRGNPGRLESSYATKWVKHDLAGVDDLAPRAFESIHGGYDTTAANEDPDRVVPVDVMRELERQGVIGKLFEHYYVTVGSAQSVPAARRFGQEIARDLAASGVDGVILTAT